MLTMLQQVLVRECPFRIVHHALLRIIFMFTLCSCICPTLARNLANQFSLNLYESLSLPLTLLHCYTCLSKSEMLSHEKDPQVFEEC